MPFDWKKYAGFSLYTGVCLILFLPIFIAPFIAISTPGAFGALQAIYAPTCHQLASRSLCYFENGSLMDCAQPNQGVTGRAAEVFSNGIEGFRFPVCARDLGIYGAMLFGAIAFALLRGAGDRRVPNIIYFVILLVPIAIDGGTQLLGFRESTNTLRLVTGALAGIAVPFYMIPILNTFANGPLPAIGLEKKVKRKMDK